MRASVTSASCSSPQGSAPSQYTRRCRSSVRAQSRSDEVTVMTPRPGPLSGCRALVPRYLGVASSLRDVRLAASACPVSTFPRLCPGRSQRLGLLLLACQAPHGHLWTKSDAYSSMTNGFTVPAGHLSTLRRTSVRLTRTSVRKCHCNCVGIGLNFRGYWNYSSKSVRG